MANLILFVFEGEKTEKSVANSLNRHFINSEDKVIIYAAYKTDIYKLYTEVFEDEFLDVFEILKEKNPQLHEFERHDFSQIYLFFDYDGHAHHACDDKISHLLGFFNEETDNGKMFISYPMIEAVKNINKPEDFYNETFKIDRLSEYKKHVNDNSDRKFIHFNNYKKDTWVQLVKLHCEKANFLLVDVIKFPRYHIEQNDIFSKQKEKHIQPNGEVSIISAFPLMILDYFGYESLLGLLDE